MIVKDRPVQPRRATIAAIAADVLMLLSSGALAIALTGRFPFSGVYSSPFGVIRIGSKPAIWVGLFVVSALVRITLRQKCGRPGRLFTDPTPACLFLVALFIYNANGRQIGAVDTIPSRLLPYSILREGNFDLDEFQFLYAQGVPAYIIQSGERLVSAYPPGPAILALPFYLLPVLGRVPPQSKLLIDVEKLAAAVLTALSVVLIYAAINRLEGNRAALLLSLIYALGTSSLSVSSQALWQHGPSQLFLAASLYCLVRGMEQPRWAALSGLTLGLAVLCRPTDLLIAIPLAAYIVQVHRDQLARFTLLALPSMIFMALYNAWYFDSALRIGYDQGFFSGNSLRTPVWEGLSGILFSPSRGLFIYSPVFLFSLLGMVLAWGRSEPPLAKYLSAAVVLVIALYSRWKIWWGGWAYGPRLLADLTPLLTLLLVPAYRRIVDRPFLRSSFYLLAGISIAIHGLGAFAPAGWSPDVGEPSRRLWSWSEGELMNSGCRLLFKVTGRCTPVDIPKLAIAIDRPAYRPGEDASVTLRLDAGKNPVAFDGYLKLFEDGRRVRFLTPEGLSRTVAPFVVSSTQPGREDIRLSFRIADDAAPGTYQLQGLLYRAGAPPASVDGQRDRLFDSQRAMFTISR